MYTKFYRVWKYLVFALMFILWLTGCAVLPGETGAQSGATAVPSERLVVLGSETARDVALAYIRTYHPGTGPSEDAFWFEETLASKNQDGSSSATYRYKSWIVSVTYPVEAPDKTIYTVAVLRSSPGYNWQGLVDAYGQVVESIFLADDSTPVTQPATLTATSPATEAPLPTATWTATPTDTATPPPTTTPTPTAESQPCNAARFVEDVTVQDGSTFATGAKFTKIWRLRNVGSCTWDGDYDVVFLEGDLMKSERSQGLSATVRPGETVDLSVDLQAPTDPGDYRGRWMLRDDGGVLFGIGDDSVAPFWVSISVVDFNENDYEVDFALDYCSATWRSQITRLPCPGFTNSPDGYVNLLANAELENRPEDEPTLWVHPNEARDGWIEGTYPSHKVQSGDHFMAWVGCLKGYDRCDLTFYLDYMDIDGEIYRLGKWNKSYDGEITQIDIDLSFLEGDRIRLILGVEGNTKNVQDAQGFWFVPRIE